jgi:hypothetical protein
VIVIKAHHCFTDGLGFAAFAMALSDNYDVSALPALKQLSFAKRVIVFLLSPYLIIKANNDLAKKRDNINSIKKDVPLSGKKRGAFSEDFDLTQIKSFCKREQCSTNDYFGALLGASLYEYFDLHKDEHKVPSVIDTLIPFSFRQPVKHLKDMKLVNDFAAVGVKLVIEKDFSTALSKQKAIYSSKLKSLGPFGSLKLV